MKRKFLLAVIIIFSICTLVGCQNNVKTQKETEVNTKINSGKESAPVKVPQNSNEPKESKQTEQGVVKNEEKEVTYYISPISGCVIADYLETADLYQVQTKCEGCGYLGSKHAINSTSNLNINFTCSQTNCPLKGKVQYAKAKSIRIN